MSDAEPVSAAASPELIRKAMRLCAEAAHCWPGSQSQQLVFRALRECLNELAELPGAHPLIALATIEPEWIGVDPGAGDSSDMTARVYLASAQDMRALTSADETAQPEERIRRFAQVVGFSVAKGVRET